MEKLKVAILGTGKLGTDLLIKVLRSPYLTCVAFVGRNNLSKGIEKARSLGVPVSTGGIEYIQKLGENFQLVFDVTNAYSHLEHWPILQSMGKKCIDLTPSHIGQMIVPAINLKQAFYSDNIGLISCGGQASLPIINTIVKQCPKVRSIEVVSSIASKSAGPGTRINIDEYIQKTETAIQFFSGCTQVKAALILNPAEPEIFMKTTIYVELDNPNLPVLKKELDRVVHEINNYIPGYRVCVGPIMEKEALLVSIGVEGRGDFLPSYAGNLDIINCAAIQIAETLSINSQKEADSCLK